MKIFTTIQEMSGLVPTLTGQGKSIGFVPTMGALHQGHITLIRQSVDENDITVCSIFVNPIQFNNPTDLEKYPRTLERDILLLEEAGCTFLFAPDNASMYPDGESPDPGLDLGMLDKLMEGKFRPGHFRGVSIVVKRLFDIIQPNKAYFGKKDYQQLAVIRHMTEKLNLPVSIIPCETVREPDGLAMSSRNMRLTIAERASAPVLYAILSKVKEKRGKIPVHELKEWAIKKIEETPGFRVEYFEIADADTLFPLEDWTLRHKAVALVAAYLGDVRLIDNLELFS
jgi:pantoate--beta-alanine ligase